MKYKTIKLGVLLTSLCGLAGAANVALVPQTGQTATLPINPAPANSDGALRKGVAWPSPRFESDPSGNCITDKLTGLMWVKDLNTVNNGNTLDWSTALTTADNGTWCGYSDWRMPNINELRSLVNYAYATPANWLMYGSGNSGAPACSGACFVNVQANLYWSSSSNASGTANAWNVDMSNGNIGTYDKSRSDTNRLFPVRGGQ